jgi:hypothetical protein
MFIFAIRIVIFIHNHRQSPHEKEISTEESWRITKTRATQRVDQDYSGMLMTTTALILP